MADPRPIADIIADAVKTFQEVTPWTVELRIKADTLRGLLAELDARQEEIEKLTVHASEVTRSGANFVRELREEIARLRAALAAASGPVVATEAAFRAFKQAWIEGEVADWDGLVRKCLAAAAPYLGPAALPSAGISPAAIARAATGYIASECCHRTGGRDPDAPNCDCWRLARDVTGAGSEGSENYGMAYENRDKFVQKQD